MLKEKAEVIMNFSDNFTAKYNRHVERSFSRNAGRTDRGRLTRGISDSETVSHFAFLRICKTFFFLHSRKSHIALSICSLVCCSLSASTLFQIVSRGGARTFYMGARQVANGNSRVERHYKWNDHKQIFQSVFLINELLKSFPKIRPFSHQSMEKE